MVKYIWELPDWPDFRYDRTLAELHAPLARCRRLQGALLHKIAAAPSRLAQKAEGALLSREALRTSEIEGVRVPPDSVRSSVARRLGLPTTGLPTPERYADGVVDMLLDATRNHRAPLTEERILSWHAGLSPLERGGLETVSAGRWRRPEKDPMQVVSGRSDRPTVHFQAPPAASVPKETTRFFQWFEHGGTGTDGVIRAGIAHLWFVTIHPFEDGNGRIARAVTDLALARDDGSPLRAYSLSNQIQSSKREKNGYYDILEATQKADGGIDAWLGWFVGLVERALKSSSALLDATLGKAEFWRKNGQTELNERQRKVLNRLLDAGPDGFEGGLSNAKYRSMTKASHATAGRDLADLVGKGLLVPNGAGGRSTRYDLAFPASRAE